MPKQKSPKKKGTPKQKSPKTKGTPKQKSPKTKGTPVISRELNNALKLLPATNRANPCVHLIKLPVYAANAIRKGKKCK